MRTKPEIRSLIEYLKSKDNSIVIDEDSTFAEYENEKESATLPIKVLSIIGGILSAIAFLSFLFIAGIYDNKWGLILTGIILIISTIILLKKTDKIAIYTLSISLYLSGFILVGVGLESLGLDENLLMIIFIFFALATLFFVKNYILTFISVLIIHSCILALIMMNNWPDLVHLYVAFLALFLAFLFLKEPRFFVKSKYLNEIYFPAKTAIVFAFVTGLVFVGKRGILPYSLEFLLLTSAIFIALVWYIISLVFERFKWNEKKQINLICFFVILALIPTAISPAISGSLFLILLCFYVNHKTGLVVGLAAFSYFLGQFYYDLNFNLLTKSIMMMSSGVVFLLIYWLNHKKLSGHEEV